MDNSHNDTGNSGILVIDDGETGIEKRRNSSGIAKNMRSLSAAVMLKSERNLHFPSHPSQFATASNHFASSTRSDNLSTDTDQKNKNQRNLFTNPYQNSSFPYSVPGGQLNANRTSKPASSSANATAATMNQDPMSINSTSDVRLVKRGGPFDQSSSRVSVNFKWKGAFENARLEWLQVIFRDIFHTLFAFDQLSLYIILIGGYTFVVLIFAAIFYQVNIDCGTDPTWTFQSAFAFALETATTVGYTLPFDNDEAFFGGCVAWLIFIYIEMIFTMMLNAVVVGVVFLRVSRADSRARQVVFSSKACIVNIRGTYYFICQAIDLDGKLPLVKASVKMATVFHESGSSVTAHFQVRTMRLSHPDDETGAQLFLSVPSTIIHRIDLWSPLLPPGIASLLPGIGKNPDPVIRNSGNLQTFPGRVLREADSENGARTVSSCPVCGTSSLNLDYLIRHIQRQVIYEKNYGINVSPCHSDIDISQLNTRAHFVPHKSTRSSIATELTSLFERKPATNNNNNTNGNQKLTSSTERTTQQINQTKSRNEETFSSKTRASNQSVDSLMVESDIASTAPAPEKPSNMPKPKATLDDLLSEYEKFDRNQITVDEAREAIKKFIAETKLEVIVFIEATDPRTSGSFQSRQSYCLNDIVFDRLFVPSMTVSSKGTAELNLHLFHETVPVPAYIEEPPPFASHS